MSKNLLQKYKKYPKSRYYFQKNYCFSLIHTEAHHSQVVVGFGSVTVPLHLGL